MEFERNLLPVGPCGGVAYAVCSAAGLGHLGTGAGALCSAPNLLTVRRQFMDSKRTVASIALAPMSISSDFRPVLFYKQCVIYDINFKS